jgi:hypothetical protein
MELLFREMKSMTTHLRRLIVAASVFALTGSAIAGGPQKPKELTTTEQVLERFIDALGGREAIEKLETRVCLGRETTDFPSYEPPVYESKNIQAKAKIPRSTLYTTLVDSYGEKTGYNGSIGWAQDKCGIRRDDYVKTAKFHWIVNPHNALLIEEYYPDLTFAGKKEMKGHIVYALEPAALDPLYWGLYFDVNSGLLVGIGFYWDLEDYRPVDGVLFPHRILTSRKGGQTWWEFFEVKHNVPINDSLFNMPSEKGN